MLLLSCKNEKEEQLKHAIVGEWRFVAIIDSAKHTEPDSLVERTYLISDFELRRDGAYTEKSGFWDVTNKSGKKVLKYYGWDARYEIESDSLFVQIPFRTKRRAIKIHSLIRDSLVCEFDTKKYTVFKRQHYRLSPKEQYDAIEVFTTTIFGEQDFESVAITRAGDVYLEGGDNRKSSDDFTASISPEDFLKLQDGFKKAGIDSLKKSYSDENSDAATVMVNFIKNGHIYKTITDYDAQSPREFKDAYNHVRFLYQTLKLEKTQINYSEFARCDVTFHTPGKKSVQLNFNQKDIFIKGLAQAKPSNHMFKPKYRAMYGYFKKDKSLETDGRYYRFPSEDGGKTLDLGYDFIERNELKLSAVSH